MGPTNRIPIAELRCVTIDCWAHGQSSNLMHTPSITEIADDHIAVLDELGIEKAIFVCSSMGGVWGINAASRHQHRVAGLLLAN